MAHLRSTFMSLTGAFSPWGPFARLERREPNKSLIYAYALDKVQDRYGNSILIDYRPELVYPVGSRKVRDLLPDQIKWGSTGTSAGWRSARFFYQTVQPYDEEHRFVGGYDIVTRDRLDRIEMHGPTGSTFASISERFRPISKPRIRIISYPVASSSPPT